jgi:hypothetical protein
MELYKIKCSNGLYVEKTTYSTWITYSKKGKIFNNINLAKKNLYLCEDFAETSNEEKYNTLKYKLEIINCE